jgi:hypothetical protein
MYNGVHFHPLSLLPYVKMDELNFGIFRRKILIQFILFEMSKDKSLLKEAAFIFQS